MNSGSKSNFDFLQIELSNQNSCFLDWKQEYCGRDPEMVQKAIEGGNVTCRNMHGILIWLKIRIVKFLLNFGSKYWSRAFSPNWLTFFSSKILRLLKIRIIFASNSLSLRILSHLKIFELKSEPTRGFDTWSVFRAEIKEKLNCSNFEPSQDPMHIPKCDIDSIDGFLTISGYPPPRIGDFCEDLKRRFLSKIGILGYIQLEERFEITPYSRVPNCGIFGNRSRL